VRPGLTTARMKAIALDEIEKVHGFMELLMRPRNGRPWTPEERRALKAHIRHLARSLPVIGIFSLPGGSLLLPLLAWFLDRRTIPRFPETLPSKDSPGVPGIR